jgi:hypothetical protein
MKEVRACTVHMVVSLLPAAVLVANPARGDDILQELEVCTCPVAARGTAIASSSARLGSSWTFSMTT